MCIILMELNYLQDHELGLVICVNKLDTLFKTSQTHFVTAVRRLKQPFTSFYPAQITQFKEKLFSNIRHAYWTK